ncbi:MAG: thioredoxin family protein [Acholeplasmataceae bacterium]|nr:thioredoxin family protein [Acholeplasmataceae bacterium]
MARQNVKKIKIDKYNKVEPKVHPITIASIIGFFVIVFGLILIFQPTNQEKIAKSYELYNIELTEDHPFYQVTYGSKLFKRGLDKIIAKEEVVVVYVGFPSCPACQTHIKGFESYFRSENVEDYTSKIYYINPNENVADFVKFQTAFPSIINSTPQLLVFIDGELVTQFSPGSSTAQTDINRSIRDFYRAAVIKITE